MSNGGWSPVGPLGGGWIPIRNLPPTVRSSSTLEVENASPGANHSRRNSGSVHKTAQTQIHSHNCCFLFRPSDNTLPATQLVSVSPMDIPCKSSSDAIHEFGAPAKPIPVSSAIGFFQVVRSPCVN